MKKISIQNPFPILFALILTAILLILVTPGWAQLSLTSTSTAVVVDFSTTLSGVNNGAFNRASGNAIFAATPVAGQLDADAWAVTADGATSGAAATFPGALNASFNDFTAVATANTGWGSCAISSDVMLAILPSGSQATPGSITLKIVNNTGSTLNELVVSYVAQAYNDQARSNKIELWHSADNTASSYTEVSSVEFTSTAVASSTTEGGTQSATIGSLNIADGNNYYLRWFFNDVGGSGSRDEFFLDDISVTGNVSSSPAISLGTMSGSALCTSSGTASGYQTFTVSGDYLTGNLTVTPPADFEVSTDGGSTYGTSQSVPVSGGNVTSEPLTVRVRIASSASAGTPSGNITVSGGGATSQTVAVSGTVGETPTLSVGDISIIGFRSDADDGISFVTWVAIPNGTSITFTDNAWDGSALLTNENTAVWTNNTGSTIAAGTVIAGTFPSSPGTWDLGTGTSGTLSGIAAGGENIFAYQGPACNPSFIHGLSTNGAWLTSGIVANETSYLPAALNVSNGNFVVTPHIDNGQFTGSRSNQSTLAAYKPIVHNSSNWTYNDDGTVFGTLSSTDFTLGSNPEVNISVTSNTATETGAPTITVTLTASAAVSGNQSVTLAVTGTNITGSDYSLSTTTLTIPGGGTSITATFQILDDSNVEGSETAILTISAPTAGIVLGTTLSQNIVITDNDGSTFYSQASGNANSGAIWDIVPSGTGQTIASLGGFSNVRSIVVQNGHTVTIGTSGTDVLDLTVNSGGVLLASTTNTNPTYLDIFGNIICNGTIGGATNGIGFDFEGTNQTISGSGSMIVTRLRKDDTQNTTTNVVINKDIDLVFGGACIYNNVNFTNIHFTIGSGYVVTVNGDTGSNGDISIDGTNGASGNERGGSITVNGSLIVSNKIFALSNNNATYPCSITIGSTGTIRTYNMDVNINNPGFTAFTINNGGTLTVTNNLAVQGGTLTTNNGVILTSGGSLMHGFGTPSGGGSVSGNITIQRQGTTSSEKYNYWSSPVSGGTLPGSGGYQYIALNGTNAYTDDNNPNPDPGWAAFSGAMTNGKGYASKGANLASFTGAPNNGSINIGVTTSSQPLSSETAPSKFNLIGNPYPCGLTAFDATNGLANNNSGVIAGSLYFWYDDGSSGSDYAANDYAVRTGVGGTAANSGGPSPSNNIGAGQGFIVEAIATGNVNFSNNMRNNNNSQFFKTEEDTFMNRIWLTLSNADLYNEILIAFKSDATEERDLLYDAYKLRGNSQITFAAVQQEEEFVIVAFPPVSSERVIPLTTYVAAAGNYTITNKHDEYMEAIPVYLEDRLLGTYTDISNNGTYSAYMSDENSVNRFYLHFAPLATSISETAEAQLKTYANGDELIVLLSNFNESKGTLSIIDMAGKEVFAQQNTNLQNNFISVSTTSFSSGIYAVNLITETNSYTVKTFVK
jgi:hypothetical protein